MPRRVLPLLLASLLAGCAAAVPAPPPAAASSPRAPAAGPRVVGVAAALTPAAGAVATTTVHESTTAVSRIMRLAPGGTIAEHHHPAHDETFFVHQGTVTAVLDGREHTVKAGDVVHIPSGTVIQGRNPGPGEATVVVVFSANGRGGPLTVPGHPQH
jgi:quercetin dioxygenase-like cupin family protein